jgi:hypothetical protein
LSEFADADNNYSDPIINETIKQNVKILNKFRFTYYALTFKKQFRDWLWKKVREEKIKKQYHPNKLLKFLEDNDMDDIDTFLHD